MRNLRINSRFDLVPVGVVLLVVVAALPIIFGGIAFDRQEVNLSDNDRHAGLGVDSNVRIDSDSNPTLLRNIVANGSNVYIVWYNNTQNTVCADGAECDIIFLRSTNNGTTFSDHIILGTSESLNPRPAITVGNEGHVFVVWQDGANILLSASSNSGSSFDIQSNTVIGTAPAPPGSKANPQILANKTGDNVYVGWAADASRFKYTTSDDNFNTVGSVFDIGTVGADDDVSTLRFGANQSHIFVVTQEDANIVFKFSSTNGTVNSFTNQTIATITAAGNHGFPNIVANSTGSEIYVSYRDDADFKFQRSEDGTTFSLTTTPEGSGIIALGNVTGGISAPFTDIALGEAGRVFVVWEQSVGSPDVIRLRTSTDEGLTFGNTIEMSATSSQSYARIAASNGMVYLVFVDPDGSSDEISLVTSSNNGKTFSSKTFLTDDAGTDRFPQVVAVNDKAYIIWESHDTGVTTITGEMNFTSVTGIPVDYTFNSTGGNEFRIGEVVKITVDDFASSGTINIPIISSTDSNGITVSLTETGADTGIFTGTFSFTSGVGSSSNDVSDILNVTADDTITATHKTAVGTTNIFPVSFTFNSTSYNLGNTPTVQVVDQNSNLDSTAKEFVTITVQTTEAGGSVSLTLEETGINSGQFGDSTDTTAFNLILVNGTGTSTPVGSTFTISAESNKVNVTSTSDPDGLLNLPLTDTDGDGIFTGEVTISSATSLPSRTIQATTCDFVNFIVNEGESTTLVNSRRIVTPCEDVTKEPILVDVRINSAGSTVQKDFLFATLRGISSTASDAQIIADGTEKGGGGGGLVRPTIVLNAVAGISAVFGGGGSDRSPPISTLDIISKSKAIDIPDHIREIIENQKPGVPINPLENESFDLPLSINEKGYPLGASENTIVTNQIVIGEPIKFKMLFYEQSDLEHVSIYMNLRDGKKSHESDAYIIYEKRSPIEIVDKNGFFGDINFEIIEGEDNKKFAIFEINFIKAMDTSDIVFKSWDFDRRGVAVLVHDAIKVGELPSENKIEDTVKEISDDISERKPVPDWIKSNAKWWGDGQIDDKTFANGIGFLISEKIIDIPIEANVSKEKNDDSEIIEEEIEQVKVPDWVKNNAKWWGEDQIDEGTFLTAIEYLVKNKIIIIS